MQVMIISIVLLTILCTQNCKPTLPPVYYSPYINILGLVNHVIKACTCGWWLSAWPIISSVFFLIFPSETPFGTMVPLLSLHSFLILFISSAFPDVCWDNPSSEHLACKFTLYPVFLGPQ